VWPPFLFLPSLFPHKIGVETIEPITLNTFYRYSSNEILSILPNPIPDFHTPLLGQHLYAYINYIPIIISVQLFA